jgi:pimeloyl-ACP methyl ester carboxylesterase
MGVALRTEPDRVDELAAALRVTGTPVAVIAGADDDAWPLPDQQDMATRLGTELVVIPDAAHSPAVENPAALLTVMLPLLRSWLSATTPTR